MTIDQYAITSLSQVQTYLGTVGVNDNALLERLINAATWKIETHCDRKFKTRTYREWHDWSGGDILFAKHFPITAVKRIGYGEATAFTVQGTTSTDLRATVEVQDDQIVLSRFASNGTETATTLTFATYATASALATQISATSGWSASLVTNCITVDLHRLGGNDAKGVAVDVTFPDESASVTRVEESTGLVHFDPCGLWTGDEYRAQNLLLEYTAGYAATNMPYDVEQVCIELVQEAYNRRDHDVNVQSESLGDYSYTLMSGAALTDSMMKRLFPYRRQSA